VAGQEWDAIKGMFAGESVESVPSKPEEVKIAERAEGVEP